MKHYPHYPKAKIKKCSCWLCGNPRKWLKQQTRQEIDNRINFYKQVKELESEEKEIKESCQ